ncbi:MAG: hypothetical protein L6R43_05045 [Planctomycetes bacterium]|nr:hypothetical protein [Planctomycetota bacterium]
MRAVLEREFVAEGSRGRGFLLRTVIGAWASIALAGRSLTTLASVALDEAGAAAFRDITLALFLLLAAATPALLVPSLLEERRRGTLDLLLASPVGPLGAALGKYLARVGTVLLWATAALPPLSLALLFGGTSWGRLLDAGAGLLGTGIEAGALALVVSAGTRLPATATVAAYLLPALHWGIGPALRGTGIGTLLPGAAAVLEATTPLPFLAGTAPGAGFRYLLSSLLLAALAIPLAARLLRREMPAGRGFLARRLPRFAIEDRLRTFLVRGNPMAWKEALLLDGSWSRSIQWGVGGLLLAGEAVFAILHAAGEWTRDRNQAWLLAGFTAVAALAAVQGASSAQGEKSGAPFEILRTTPLTAREMTRGKLLGLVAGTAPLLLVPSVHLVLSVVAGYLHPLSAALTGLLALFAVANAAVHGLAWGLVAGSATAALLGGASFVAFAHGSCALLCPAAVAVFFIGAARRTAGSWEFLGLIVLPAILCGPPYYLLVTAPRELERGLTEGFQGFGILAMSLFVLFLLLLTALFIVYDARRMPVLLERELFRMTHGEDPGFDGPVRARARQMLEEARGKARAKEIRDEVRP